MSPAAHGPIPRRRNGRVRPAKVRLSGAMAATRVGDDPRVRTAGSACAELTGVLRDLLGTLDPAAAPQRAALLAGRFGSMSAIARAGPGRIATLVGEAAAALLAAHDRAARFAAREAALRGPVIATRYELLEYLHRVQSGAASESLRVFYLDVRRMLLREEVIAGAGGAIGVAPREIVARALEHGAVGLLLVHNHPGGDPSPSAADRAFTRALSRAAALFDILLHDHLVVADRLSARIAID